MSSEVGIHPDQVLNHVVFIRPGGCLTQSRLTQQAALFRMIGKRDDVLRRLLDIARRDQRCRRPDEFFNPTHSGADQWHASQQSLLSDQRAGFPGGGQQRKVSGPEQRTDIVASAQ